MMKNRIIDILNEEALLLESGVRIPRGTTSAKILHHDDFDGVMSAIAMGLQLKKQGISKITTDILHDRDTEYEQEKKLAKRKNQMLVVVDFNRFKNKDLADKNIDVHTDHHEPNEDDKKNSSSKSVGKTQYGSDVLHISTTKAQGFFTGSDLAIMNGVDSAKFNGNVSTNLYLQRELKKNDGVQNKKMRLAIITSSVLGQIVRSSGTSNAGAIKSIINNMIKSPSLIRFYSEVKKHITLQKEQVALLNAYEGKENGEIDWEAIEKYNEKAPKEMRIGVTRSGTIRKSEDTKRGEATSEEELAKRNLEGQASRDLKVVVRKGDITRHIDIKKATEKDKKEGKISLRADKEGDADLAPWDFEDKYAGIPTGFKSNTWNEVMMNHGIDRKKTKWKDIPEEKQNIIKKEVFGIFDEKLKPYREKMPHVSKKTENISVQKDYKGNRYLPYEDEKIAANIRDFWKFFQMALAPNYYDKFINAAKKKNIDFKPEELDLVDLGKKAMMKAKSEMFTTQELKKRGIENPEKLSSILNKAFDADYAKSGGHKAITNINFETIYKETYDKYKDIEKRTEKSLDKKRSPEVTKKLETIKKEMSDRIKKISTLLREFKERVQTILTNSVQEKITNTKKELSSKMKSSLKEEILSNIKF